jgi:hypothetical protein
MGKAILFAITNGDAMAELLSIFEDGMKARIGEVAAEVEDDEVAMRAADNSVESADDSAGTASLQTGYDAIQSLFNTSTPSNMEKALHLMADLTRAL